MGLELGRGGVLKDPSCLSALAHHDVMNASVGATSLVLGGNEEVAMLGMYACPGGRGRI